MLGIVLSLGAHQRSLGTRIIQQIYPRVEVYQGLFKLLLLESKRGYIKLLKLSQRILSFAIFSDINIFNILGILCIRSILILDFIFILFLLLGFAKLIVFFKVSLRSLPFLCCRLCSFFCNSLSRTQWCVFNLQSIFVGECAYQASTFECVAVLNDKLLRLG